MDARERREYIKELLAGSQTYIKIEMKFWDGDVR